VLDRRQQALDLVRLGHLHLDDVPDAILAEEELSLLQRHEDEGPVVIRCARRIDAADDIGLLQPT